MIHISKSAVMEIEDAKMQDTEVLKVAIETSEFQEAESTGQIVEEIVSKSDGVELTKTIIGENTKNVNTVAAMKDESVEDEEMASTRADGLEESSATTMRTKENQKPPAMRDEEQLPSKSSQSVEMVTNVKVEKVEKQEVSTTSRPEETKKRSLEEDLLPVLQRLPSHDRDCTSQALSSDLDLIRVKKDKFKIGRKSDNDLVIPSVFISRNHCVLYYDENDDNWKITNLSSMETLINQRQIERNETEIIKHEDILQLSSSDMFKYKFMLLSKESEFPKCPRLESSNCELGSVLNRQRSFVEFQENERKDLEKQLTAKQEEQEQLKQELEKLLQDQKVTKICNEELNNQITNLQKKIEIGNLSELELQLKYRDLLQILQEEKLKFEEKLTEEKQKWQEALQESKKEKEKLESTMAEQMQEMQEKLVKKQQEEWQKKIDNLLQEEKNIQTKLQDEKQLLEQKLKEMEETLKKKEQTQQKPKVLFPMPLRKCILIEVKNKNNIQKLPVLETIDLTGDSAKCSSSKRKSQDETVIDKVNHIMDEQLTCCICSELFITAMTLNCMHTFCQYCIEIWYKKQRQCPNCRAEITSMTRSLVVDNFIEKMLESLTPEQMHKRQQLCEERQRLSIVKVSKRAGRRK